MSIARTLRGAARALVARAQTPSPPLRVHSEFAVLDLVAEPGESLAGHAMGVVAPVRPAGAVDESAALARYAGRAAGHTPPSWHDGSGGVPSAGLHICRVRGALHAPGFGAVILPDGRVLESSVAEALYFTPDLSALPFVESTPAGPVMTPSGDPPRLRGASVFVAWGGLFNYGHFLLDCLPALMALEQADLTRRLPPITPPLNPWQRRALELAFGPSPGRPGLVVRELRAPLVRVDELAFASPMNHFLHAPAAPLDAVRARMLAAAAPTPNEQPRRVYLTRRHDEKRRMVNEAELEQALALRGFQAVRVDTLSLDKQVALFHNAEAIVAPTGAALANCLFCRPGTPVFEIQPINYTGIWVRGVCHLVGADWHGYFAPSPLEETEVHVGGELKPGVLFSWRTPIDDFLTFLDARLAIG